MVRYYDDQGVAHIVYAAEAWEINFLRERFCNIEILSA